MSKKRKKKNIILIVIVSLICIFIILLGLLVKYSKISNDDKNEIEQSQSENSIKSIINNLGSIFQKEVVSEEKGFSTDIYLRFKYNLYENNKSQKVMYENLLRQICSNKSTSFRLIDENRNIIIRVYFDNTNNSFYYTVNGKENYFDKADAKKAFENVLNVEEINVDIDSSELKNIIDNDWKTNTDISATKESFCGNYDIYFEEGIKIRNISRKVYNIIFTKNYKKSVFSNIYVGDDFKKVEDALGKPSFEDNNVIGYKTKKFYIFFTEKEISIYRIEKYNYDEFEELLNQYIEEKIDVKTFTNKLTDLWNDYEEFNYDSNYVCLNYPLQGVSMILNAETPYNIIIYSNYENKNDLKDLIENNKIVGNLDKDFVFETEKNRIQKASDSKALEHLDNEDFVGESKLFSESVQNNKVEFYSKDESLPDCTLIDVVNSYVWVDDDIFVYSIEKNGIYYFDLNTREKHDILVEDNKEKNNYTFKDFKNGILTFDDDRTINIFE